MIRHHKHPIVTTRWLLLLLSFIVGHFFLFFCLCVCVVFLHMSLPSSLFTHVIMLFVHRTVGNDCAFKCCFLTFPERTILLVYHESSQSQTNKQKKGNAFQKVLYYSPPQLPDIVIIIICTLAIVRLISFCIYVL